MAAKNYKKLANEGGGLSEFKQTSGFPVGTMQSAQDVYEAWIKYFNEELFTS